MDPYKGGWRAAWSKMDPTTGKRVRGSKTFPKGTPKATAEAWLREQTAAPAVPDTLGAWLTEWLALHKVDAEHSTYHRDEYTVDRLVRPHLGAVKLRDLTPLRINRYLADLADRHSDSERHRAATTLRNCLNSAVRNGKLSASPMARVKMPSVDRKEWVSLTRDQLAALIVAADRRGVGGLARLWADAGVRVGELLGLKWEDYNPATRELTIRRAICPKSGAIKPTKTKRVRRVILSRDTARHLHPRDPAAPMFPSVRSRGNHQRVGNFTGRTWRPLLEAAGLTGLGLTPRSMRHTCATLLLGAGVNIRTVADRLGHRDPALTLRVYSHAIPGDQAKAADTMDAMFLAMAEHRSNIESGG